MVSKFRLLMTTDVKSEVWDYSLTLVRALLKNISAEILMVSLGGKPTENQLKEAAELNIKLEFTDFPLDYCINTEENSGFSQAKEFFDRKIKDFDPHILHLNHNYLNFGFNKPCLSVCHGDLLNKKIWCGEINRYNPMHKNLFKYRDFVKKSLNNSDIVITQSRFAAESLVRVYDFKKRIEIIYNGIDYKPHLEMPDSPTLLASGNSWDKSKNLNLLINISHRLPENIKIRVIGSTYPDRKLPKNIEFLSNLPHSEVMEAYRNSSIYLALSNYETNCISSIQAAYSGCAILANDVPVFRELWGDCAYIFERNNVNSLMKSLNNLIENKKLLEITSKNCQAKALSVFNSKRMAYEYINLYKDVLRKRQSKEKVS